jgi:hypothetical protein
MNSYFERDSAILLKSSSVIEFFAQKPVSLDETQANEMVIHCETFIRLTKTGPKMKGI